MADQSTWKDAVPFLDEALDCLSPEDQKLILQRFYEEKKFKDIARQNGQTESACKKRVQRALQKLSSLLTSRGVTLTGTAVASLLGAEFARAVPAHTAAALAPKALAASSSLSSTTVVANTIQTMSTVKTTSLTAAVVLVLAALPISQELAEGKKLRFDLQSVRGQPASAANASPGSKGPSRSPVRKGLADWRSPRTPRSILNSLAASPDSRDLVNEVVSEGMGNYDLLAASILIARLASLSEDFANTVFRALVVGLAESRPGEALEVLQSRPDLAQSVALEVTSGLAKAMMATGDDTQVREMMTLRDQSDVLSVVLREHGRAGNFGRGVAVVDRLTPDPQQRNGILARAVRGQKTVKANHAALDWILDNTPAQEAAETFRSIGAEGAIRGDWLEQQEAGPIRDHVYLGGVERRVKSLDFPEAFSQAREIADEELRATAMERLGRQWLRRDERAATRLLPDEVLRQLQNQ